MDNLSTLKSPPVAGIDVGGCLKGFHAVLLQNGEFWDTFQNKNPASIFKWCLQHGVEIVGVDAPCGWSLSGSSRLAERELKLFGRKIPCFMTPTLDRAKQNQMKFYEWVFNGERLYQELIQSYTLFKGERNPGKTCFETFPQAISCALEGRLIPAKLKLKLRPKVLRKKGYHIDILSNIDLIDAALCAVSAYEFYKGNFQQFGDIREGFILIPR
jgi:predicted nuclease with RNAse H fold